MEIESLNLLSYSDDSQRVQFNVAHDNKAIANHTDVISRNGNVAIRNMALGSLATHMLTVRPLRNNDALTASIKPFRNGLETRTLKISRRMSEALLAPSQRKFVKELKELGVSSKEIDTLLTGTNCAEVQDRVAAYKRMSEADACLTISDFMALEQNRGKEYVAMSTEDQSKMVASAQNLLNTNNGEFFNGIIELKSIIASECGSSAKGINADNVSRKNTFSTNAKAVEMGLQNQAGLPVECARFATMAYANDFAPAEKLNGWTPLTQSGVEGQQGFSAKAYEKDGVIVIAFRGSDDKADIEDDKDMLQGKLTQQYFLANGFYASIRQANPDKKIVVTGHSLGGALAELVASSNEDVLGLTFDAVGTKHIVEQNGLKDNNNTCNYVIEGDLISNSYEHVGEVVLMPAGTVNKKTGKAFDEHAVQNFTRPNVWEATK